MRVLIGADATRAIETSSDEFRTLVLGAIFSDVVTGKAFAENMDLLEDAIEDPRNENIKGFSQKEMVKEMKRVVKDVGEQPIGKLLRGQKFYAKFEIGKGDEIEKPFGELKLNEILDDEKIKRLLGFRQMQRPPTIQPGKDGFITSSYLKKAIKEDQTGLGIKTGETLIFKLSESDTVEIDGSKVDYLQKEGYSPYLTPVTGSRMNFFNKSGDKIKDDGLYSEAKEMLKGEFKEKEVLDFLNISKAKENENFEDYSVRIKNSVKKNFFNYLISNLVKKEILLDIFYSQKDKITESSKDFEGMSVLEVLDNPDVFIQRVYPNDWNLYDMELEVESTKTKFKVKLSGIKTHGLFETGIIPDIESSEQKRGKLYKPIGSSVPLGTQRKGADYRRKLRDFAAVIRNNYLELMEV